MKRTEITEQTFGRLFAARPAGKEGNDAEEIVCALAHAMPYMGVPRLFNALNCAKELLS